jgi:hypothetical protein
MDSQRLYERILCGHANIPSEAVRKGLLTQVQEEALGFAIDSFENTPLYIADQSEGVQTIEDVELELTKLAARASKPALVIIDHFHLLTGEQGEGMRVEFSNLSRSIKSLAGRLQIPILALCQLSREVDKRKDKRPVLGDLRETGGLEENADIVMFIWREDYQNPEAPNSGAAELLVRKQREGPTGTIHLTFDRAITTFKTRRARKLEMVPRGDKVLSIWSKEVIERKIDELLFWPIEKQDLFFNSLMEQIANAPTDAYRMQWRSCYDNIVAQYDARRKANRHCEPEELDLLSVF